jgi:hypothetical protein
MVSVRLSIVAFLALIALARLCSARGESSASLAARFFCFFADFFLVSSKRTLSASSFSFESW